MLTQVVQSLKISSDIQRKELKFLGFTSISIVLFFSVGLDCNHQCDNFILLILL